MGLTHQALRLRVILSPPKTITLAECRDKCLVDGEVALLIGNIIIPAGGVASRIAATSLRDAGAVDPGSDRLEERFDIDGGI